LILNAEAAKAQRIPFCQDTGYAVVFVHRRFFRRRSE
jgi:tartrate dehydratase alpha subunit/fumarate hydratase class I-like protein